MPPGHAVLVEQRLRARLIDAGSGELLLTASYSPDAAGDPPAIGSADRTESLIDQSLSQLARRLAPRVMEQL